MNVFDLNNLKDPDRAIKAAGSAAIFVGGATTFFALIATARRSSFGGILGPSALIDAALTFVLAFGIFKRSRTCAAFMFIYWVASRLYLVYCHSAQVSVVPFVFALVFFAGMTATFDHHRRLRERGASGPTAGGES